MATHPGLAGATAERQEDQFDGAATLQGDMTPASGKKEKEGRKRAGWMPWCLALFALAVLAAILIAVLTDGAKSASAHNGPRKSMLDMGMACLTPETPTTTANGYIIVTLTDGEPRERCLLSKNITNTIVEELAAGGVTIRNTSAFLAFPFDLENLMPANASEFWVMTTPDDDMTAIRTGLLEVLSDPSVQAVLTQRLGLPLLFAGTEPTLTSGEFGPPPMPDDDGPSGPTSCEPEVSNEDRLALVTGDCSDISIDSYPFGVVDTAVGARWYYGASTSAHPMHIGKWTYLMNSVGYNVPRLTRSDDDQSWVWQMTHEYVRGTDRPYQGFQLNTVIGKIAGAHTESGEDIGVIGNNYNGRVQIYALKYDSSLEDHRLEWDTPIKVIEGTTAASLYQFASDSRLLFVCNNRMYVFKAAANDELEELADLDATNTGDFIAHDGTIYFTIDDGTTNSLARLDESAGSYSVNNLGVDLLPQRSFASKLWGENPDADLASYTAADGLVVEKVLTPAGGDIASTTALVVCGGRMWVQWDDASGDTISFAGQSGNVGMMWVESDGTLGSDVTGDIPWLAKNQQSMGCLGNTAFMMRVRFGVNGVSRIDATASAPAAADATGDGSAWSTWLLNGIGESTAPGVGFNHASTKERLLLFGETAESESARQDREAFTYVEFAAGFPNGPNATNLEVPRPSDADGSDSTSIGMCELGGKHLVFSLRDVGSAGVATFSVRELDANGVDSTIIMTTTAEYPSLSYFRGVACNEADGVAYFRLHGQAEGAGEELYYWRLGMSSAVLAADVVSGIDGSFPIDLTLLDDGKVAFTTPARQGVEGARSHVFDPSDNSTTLITPAADDVDADVSLRAMVSAGNRLFGLVHFSGTDDWTSRCKLHTWSVGDTDTTLVDVLPEDGVRCPDTYGGSKLLAVVNGYLFLASASLAGIETILQVDTTSLTLVNELAMEVLSSTGNMQAVGNDLYFTAHTCGGFFIGKVDTTLETPEIDVVARFAEETSSLTGLAVASPDEMYTCSKFGLSTNGYNSIVRINGEGQQTKLGGATEHCLSHFECRQFSHSATLDGSLYTRWDTGAFGYEYVRLNNNA